MNALTQIIQTQNINTFIHIMPYANLAIALLNFGIYHFCKDKLNFWLGGLNILVFAAYLVHTLLF